LEGEEGFGEVLLSSIGGREKRSGPLWMHFLSCVGAFIPGALSPGTAENVKGSAEIKRLVLVDTLWQFS